MKYYCEYCDTYLTHDSPTVRSTHRQGRKHKDNVKYFYQQWMADQTQRMIDATTAAFKAGTVALKPSAHNQGAANPPGTMPPPELYPGGPVGSGGPMMMGPYGSMPLQMMGPTGPMVGPPYPYMAPM